METHDKVCYRGARPNLTGTKPLSHKIRQVASYLELTMIDCVNPIRENKVTDQLCGNYMYVADLRLCFRININRVSLDVDNASHIDATHHENLPMQ